MVKPRVTAHMIVKNEDRWVFYALHSILPYVDSILVTDTGSSDQTISVIQSIASPKIQLDIVAASTPSSVTAVRADQLSRTKTDWIWIIDGDEIYPEATGQECLKAVQSQKYEGIVVRRYDLLGDIYHRQHESVGSYNLFGQTGHLVTRLLNLAKIKGLHYSGDYPNEGWFDAQNNSTRSRDPKSWFITKNYLYHAMYLTRSSLGSNLPMFNRSKFKIESGIPLVRDYPRVFDLPHPLGFDPCARRGFVYEGLSSILTPIKQLKRVWL